MQSRGPKDYKDPSDLSMGTLTHCDSNWFTTISVALTFDSRPHRVLEDVVIYVEVGGVGG